MHRLVVNLVRLGLLSRNPRTDRYRPGLLLAELGTISLSRLGLREKARPIMQRLAEQTGEVVARGFKLARALSTRALSTRDM